MAIRQLDITRDHCPMTFVKAKLELSRLQAGDLLDVLLTEGEPLENVPRSAAELGHTIVEIAHVAGAIHRVRIRKGRGAAQ